MKTPRLLLVAACAVSPALAQYVYDYPALLNPYNSSQWTANGSISASNNMVTTSSAGSLILNPTVPGVSKAYEVETTLTLTGSGGNYYTYLWATTNASLPNQTGTGVYVAINNPTFTGTSCTSQLVVTVFNFVNYTNYQGNLYNSIGIP